MLRLICIGLACVAVSGPAAAGGNNVRFWTDNTGTFAVRARLAEFDRSASTVTLKLSDGDKVVVPLRRLSADDQAWLQRQDHDKPGSPAMVSGIRWFADLHDAQTVAVGDDQPTDDKPIMCFRALGELSGFM